MIKTKIQFQIGYSLFELFQNYGTEELCRQALFKWRWPDGCGVIQLDDAYWGGERHGGKRGRGSANKVPFAAAVSVDEEGHPVAMDMTVVKGFRLNKIAKWSKHHVQPNSTIISDGLSCFSAVKEAACYHLSIVTGGGSESVSKEESTWVSTMLGNVKNAITGTYHAINPKHLPRYLAEFCYRHNRRFQLEDMLPRFGYIAVRTPPMPGRLLKLAEACGVIRKR